MSLEVERYIDGTPAAVQPLLRELRRLIVAAYPEAEETIYNGQFPVYLIDGQWAAGFASRGKGPLRRRASCPPITAKYSGCVCSA